MNEPRVEPDGPLVSVCGGHRCAALWGLNARGQSDEANGASGVDSLWSSHGPKALREATVRWPGGILVRLSCPGTCAEAPVVVVAARLDGSKTGVPLWVVCADRPGRLELLLRWLAAGWDRGMPTPPTQLRGALRRVGRIASPGQRSA